LIFIFFIFNDIKKVIIARKATEEAKKRTEEIMESRHKLLLSVSHDIKSPLSSILGYLELMEIDATQNEEKRVISSMKNSADHILSLLTNLLNFSKLDQGKESLITSEFCVNKLCNDLNEMFSPLAKNKHLTFIYNNYLDNDTFIKSDALKIKQILSNILSNAIKYTIDGKVYFNVSHEDNYLIFKISDEGIGIPKDKLDEIFKPFSRIDNNESLIEGNGFGLFVVKGLIDLLNGEINVSSELGKGSEFIIKIPVEFIYKKEIKEKSTDIQKIKSNIKLNILVIDDDKTLLSVIESMLNKLEISCEICHSSLEFDKILTNINNYDLILTDREMGAFSGLDVLKKVKEINKDKKVVLMTARSEYNNEVACQNGFDDYLRKPFSINDLALLFNTNFDIRTDNISKYQNDFPELCSMFDNDCDINNILTTFAEVTSHNIITFNEIINANDFSEAVKLCHKMYPMFVQLNQKDSADFLLRMDKSRGKDESSFPEWKEKSIEFLNNVDDFLLYLSEKFGIE
jgi:CheY-like chemotaxis protein